MRAQAIRDGIGKDGMNLDNSPEGLRRAVVEKLFFQLAKFPGVATRNDLYLAFAFAIRDRMLDRWVRSARTFLEKQSRTVVYLSAEYLMGPQLGNNLLSLGMEDVSREALRELGIDLASLIEHEEEPGLGNGGLGRLAACFMDSLATIEVPAIGHGIRYEFGIFDQSIRDGWQIEKTDRWLRPGNPWEVRRYEIELAVGLGGRTEHYQDGLGRYRVRWIPERVVKGVPYDTAVLGYGTQNANFLRLWSAIASEEFDLSAFNVGQYSRAVEDKVRSENITKVLYPNDESPQGKQLRLEQEYFFVSCALQDCIRLLTQVTSIEHFADKFAIQLNDTHPALAVAELMRLLVDVHDMSWDQAWDITRRSFAYTNHTLMPEALETWPLPLFRYLLPRHLEIIYELNHRFLEEAKRKFPREPERLARLSLIDEHGEKSVRMANLATIASSKVNGVAALHSRLLRETVMKDFAELWPERFTNVTNGVTPRRFIAQSNPALTALITEAIGDGWLRDLDRLKGLERLASDAGFQDRFRAVKAANKRSFVDWLKREHGLPADPESMFDAQCKRIHEYKRQHLAVLHAIALFERIRTGRGGDITPRTFVFAGKAAPGYHMAKLIIRLIHGVGQAIAAHPEARRLLSVVFVPDFNVKTAQRIYPAADLSEQISTAGKEASGTGNMKFAMNGALTIGTLDGANVEIREQVGAENFFLFGLTAEEVFETWRRGYDPQAELRKDPELARAVEIIASGELSGGDRSLFGPFLGRLVHNDPFLALADFRSYVECQERVGATFRDRGTWANKAILNVARTGYFSSDRSIAEYAKNIWRTEPVKVK